jgi:hypothetical protein
VGDAARSGKQFVCCARRGCGKDGNKRCGGCKQVNTVAPPPHRVKFARKKEECGASIVTAHTVRAPPHRRPLLRERRCGTALSSVRRRTGNTVATSRSARHFMRRLALEMGMDPERAAHLAFSRADPPLPPQRGPLPPPRLALLTTPRPTHLTAVRASSACAMTRRQFSRGAHVAVMQGSHTSSAGHRMLLIAWQTANNAMGGGSAGRAGRTSPVQ